MTWTLMALRWWSRKGSNARGGAWVVAGTSSLTTSRPALVGSRGPDAFDTGAGFAQTVPVLSYYYT